jgi:hypothetical protein
MIPSGLEEKLATSMAFGLRSLAATLPQTSANSLDVSWFDNDLSDGLTEGDYELPTSQGAGDALWKASTTVAEAEH